MSIYPKEFFGSSNITANTGQCFVLMPFAEKFLETYDTIRKAIEGDELNMTCYRADDITGADHIILSILRKIAESEFIIADLTDKNPNVFYELGIVHMVKDYEKAAVLLTQNMDFVPFDLRQFRCIIYEPSRVGYFRLSSQLTAALKELTKEQLRFVVQDGQSLLIPKSYLGKEDRHLHELELFVSGVGDNEVKCQLKVYRIARDKSRSVVFDEWKGMDLGNPFRHNLPVSCELRLQKAVRNQNATFVLSRTDNDG
jgi:hypothetical protein